MEAIDIKIYCEQLQESLTLELDIIGQQNREAISKASKCMVVLSGAIAKLKNFVHRYKFRDNREEIQFFKEIKPVLVSQYYYYEKVFAIRVNEPFIEDKSLRAYYKDQLDELHQVIRMHQEFYRYCLSNSKDLDDKYFTRTDNPIIDPDIDSKFSTGYDNTLARILASQLVKEYLIKLIQNIDIEGRGLWSQLKWTGSKTALIELVYALRSVDSVNGGKADIRQIAYTFETVFNISLGNYYRHFQEIRQRKSGKTTFLDLMRERFIQRMDELDEK